MDDQISKQEDIQLQEISKMMTFYNVDFEHAKNYAILESKKYQAASSKIDEIRKDVSDLAPVSVTEENPGERIERAKRELRLIEARRTQNQIVERILQDLIKSDVDELKNLLAASTKPTEELQSIFNRKVAGIKRSYERESRLKAELDKAFIAAGKIIQSNSNT